MEPRSEILPSDDLNLLREFVNTKNVEAGEDEVGTPELLGAWLAARKLLSGGPVEAEAHQRAIAIREGLRELGGANNGEPVNKERIDELNRAAANLPVVVRVAPDDWHLRPSSRGVDGFLAGLLGTLARSMADGSWARVKSCRRDDCRWLFFDQSRNRSGTWCSMAGCGSLMKSRAYRARRREAAHDEAPHPRPYP
jgi:predicted RNA-binding Zn ribbon-like protein